MGTAQDGPVPACPEALLTLGMGWDESQELPPTSLYERQSTFREGSSPASQVLDPAVTE